MRRLVAAASLAALLAGCAGVPDGPAPTSSPGEPLPESTFSRGPGASYRGLPVTGVLVLDADGCLRLDAEPGMLPSGRTDVVWPAGTTLRRLSSGEAEVVWSDGSLAARTGDRIQASGGAGADADEAGPCVDPARAFTLEAIYSTGR